jgi:hypothetical protein
LVVCLGGSGLYLRLMVALAEPDSGETVNSYVSRERGPTRILYPASQVEETDQTTKQKKAASRELGQIIYRQPNVPLVISTGVTSRIE